MIATVNTSNLISKELCSDLTIENEHLMDVAFVEWHAKQMQIFVVLFLQSAIKTSLKKLR